MQYCGFNGRPRHRGGLFPAPGTCTRTAGRVGVTVPGFRAGWPAEWGGRVWEPRCTRVNLMSRESHAAGWGREKWSGRTEIPHHHGLVRVRKGKGTGVPGTRSSPPASSPVVDWYPYHGDTTKSLQEEGKGRNSRPGAPEHTLLLCPMSKMCVFKNYTTV